ncbi:hypothetical protein ACYSNU_04920 [Enterococcus sp. LJL120]
MYEKIYKDFSDWLKFTEAKILATLTIQIGLLYFIYKVENMNYKNLMIAIGTVVCIILIFSIVPKLNTKSDNVLYYGSWLNKDFNTKDKTIEDFDYWKQCSDLAYLIKKKMIFFRVSIILLMLEGLVILVPFVLSICEALK